MTQQEIKQLIQEKFKQGVNELKYDYENERKADNFEISETLNDIKIFVKVTREDLGGSGMLIAPKLSKRLRIKVGVGRYSSYAVTLLQENKNELRINDSCFEEMPEIAVKTIKVVASLLGEVLDRTFTIKTPADRKES